jgi:ferric-dicitrate binding protein FerR (iron transport regulator)
MEDKRLQELADKFISGRASPEEAAELHAWWDSERISEEEQVVVTKHPDTNESVKMRLLSEINRQIDEETGETLRAGQPRETPLAEEPRPAPSKLRKMAPRWLAAASLLAAVAILSVLIPAIRHKNTDSDAAEAIKPARAIQPGGNKATLVLSTGQTIRLDSAREGLVTEESGAEVSKQGRDRLVYSASKDAKGSFNIIRTPKGGQYQVKLPDGTNVWLNAASSLRFPTVFDRQRQVELSGEAYFDVAHDPAKPFTVIVSPGEGKSPCTVTALGTEFDINSYEDENSVTTTLIRGSVRVAATANNRSELLKPGQQAILDKDQNLQVTPGADSDKVLSWRDGLFKFRNDSIESIMRQMARWYDVDVEYSGKIPEHFVSTLPRNVSLYDDLLTLEKTGRVRFEVIERTIRVLPADH